MPLTAEVLREHVIDSSAKLRDSFVRIDAQVRMQNNKMERRAEAPSIRPPPSPSALTYTR